MSPREPYSEPLGTLAFSADDEPSRALAALDEDLAILIAELKEVRCDIDGDGFLSLARAIVDQQISLAAARTIWGRFEQFCGGRVTPEATLAASDEELRSCGLSRPKAAALRDLSQHVMSGQLDFDLLATQDDETVIDTLIQVRGIGRWTAQMFLIFSLGRLDVFALDDGGLRRAVAALKGIDTDAPKELIEAITEDWSPYRTVAALYLWKTLHTSSGGT